MSGIKVPGGSFIPSGGARVISKAAALMSQKNPLINQRNSLNLKLALNLFEKGQLPPPHTPEGIRAREILSQARKDIKDALDPRLWVNRQTENMTIFSIPGDDKMRVRTGPNKQQMNKFLKEMGSIADKAFSAAEKGGNFKGAATKHYNNFINTAARFMGTNVLPSTAATIAVANNRNTSLVRLVDGYQKAVRDVSKHKATDRSITNPNSRLNKAMRKVANFDSQIKKSGLNIKYTPWMKKGMKIATSYRKAGVGKGNKRRNINIRARKRLLSNLANERKSINSMAGNVRTGMRVQGRYINAKARNIGVNPGFWTKSKINSFADRGARTIFRIFGQRPNPEVLRASLRGQIQPRKGTSAPIQAKNSPTSVRPSKG